MDIKKKIRKVPVQSSSSSEDDSSSSTSSSTDGRRAKHRTRKQRNSSSSSGEEVLRKSHKHQHKKSSSRKHSHSSKIRSKMLATNSKKELRSISPTSRAAHKHHLKSKSSKKTKLIDEHERHPIRRDVLKERTPEHRITSPTTRIRVSIPNNRVQERIRTAKDSPSASTSRRHVREAPDDRVVDHFKQKEKMRRMQEEEHYKYMPKRLTPDKHHPHERSRSRSHGRVPIRERLDKEYDYRRSVSRDREYSPMIRGGPVNSRNEQMPVERPYDYRGGGGNNERLPPHEYGAQSRIYEERHHPRGSNWDEQEHRRGGGGGYEGGGNERREWDHSHDRKRGIEDGGHYKERWNDSHRSEKEHKEWRGGANNWKDSHSSNQIAPTMSHPRRWPNSNDSWAPRASHPGKHDSPSGGPPFKPRGSPYFGFKRFPFKRFPNQFSKINFSSKRVIPSATETSSSPIEKTEASTVDVNVKADDKIEIESGEIPSEIEEEKSTQQQPDTTTLSSGGIAEVTEECEGNLSEFSDVDDDILNREEVNSNKLILNFKTKKIKKKTLKRLKIQLKWMRKFLHHHRELIIALPM